VEEVKVVVAADNAAANRFYERVGFRCAGTTEVHRGHVSNVWVSRCRS
jgi:RimJ/RimL family protein N-acetyltransferase